jgi:hypothetical protein
MTKLGYPLPSWLHQQGGHELSALVGGERLEAQAHGGILEGPLLLEDALEEIARLSLLGRSLSETEPDMPWISLPAG